MRRTLCSMMAVLSLSTLVPSLRARADLPPPPDPPQSKRVPATIELDWGVFADRVSRRHTVAAGETLRAIATKELGGAAHVKAIVEANADTIHDPDKIRTGDVIWLPSVKSLSSAAKPPAPPPAAPPADAPPPPTAPLPAADAPALAGWYEAFWIEPADHRRRTAAQFKARATPGEPAHGELMLLPRASAVALIAALAKGPVPMPPAEFPGLLKIHMWSDSLVHREDPTVRIVTTYKLTGASGTDITSDIARVRYDVDGKVVTKEWVVPPPSYGNRGDAQPQEEGKKSVPVTNPPSTPPAPSPAGDPTPAPAPKEPAMAALAITASGAQPPATVPPSDDDGSHWPASTGIFVALGGAAIVAGLWIYRRSRVPTPPPPA